MAGREIRAGGAATLILWRDDGHDPAENMRRDAALLERMEAGSLALPVLRLFRFDPRGITLGAAQRPERVLDLDRCRRDGIPWAIRPTGGRAIFHAEEWTYSLTAPISHPRWGGPLRASYDAVAKLLIGSLLRLGVPVAPDPAGPARRASRADAEGACFASTAGHEIVIGERKLLGSAQRRMSRALLQQGSLLLGAGHLRLADYLAGTDAVRETTRAELERRTVHAGAWLGSAPIERWADALVAGLGASVARLDGVAGLEALTLAEAGSYTPTRPPPPDAPSRRAP